MCVSPFFSSQFSSHIPTFSRHKKSILIFFLSFILLYSLLFSFHSLTITITMMAFNKSPRSSENSNHMRKSFTGNPFSKPSIIANPRSFYPNTPANSPSEFPRRNSVACRESIGSLRDLDDKENGKDQILKSAKARSPAAASSKGTKNFMSPTISASCKIAESPRKKILVERNEPVPTSVLSAGANEPVPTSVLSAEAKSHVRKVTFAEPLECAALEERKLDALFDGVPQFEEIQSSCLTFEDLSGESKTVHDDASVPLAPKNDTDLSFEADNDMNMDPDNEADIEPSFESITQDHDCVNLDLTFKLSPTPPPASSTASILAPLDADPLMPPYDPKTNYLSPRPQFLHYKPRPRVELSSESSLSTSFSDTEFTEDSQSEGLPKESEDVSSDETVKEEESQISEPISPAKAAMHEETVEANEVPKRRFSMRSKAFGLILLLSVAFLSISVTNSPVIDHAVFEDIYEAYETSEFSEFARANVDHFSQLAKTNYDGLAQNFHIWFTKSLSSVSELISNVRGLHVHSLAQLQYCNFTLLHDHVAVNQYPVFGTGKTEIFYTPNMHPPALHVQESDAAEIIGTHEDIEDISAEHYEVYEEQLQQDLGVITVAEKASVAPESVEVLVDQPAPIIEAKQKQEDYANKYVENASELEQALQLVEAGSSEPEHGQDDAANFNVENQQGLSSEASEIDIDVHGPDDLDTKQAQKESSNLGLKHLSGLDSEAAEIHTEVYDDETDGNSLPIDAAVRGNELGSEITDIPPIMVLCLLISGGAVLIASAAYNWSKKGKSKRKRVTGSVEPLLDEELQGLKKRISPEKPSLRSGGPTEMEVREEPCPSEMSSFQTSSSSYSRRVEKQFDEGHSLEQKRKSNSNYRRESLASTTSESSYGSLTVYEKISSKQGDEGTVTPVRRSSRIRNLATSPM